MVLNPRSLARSTESTLRGSLTSQSFVDPETSAPISTSTSHKKSATKHTSAFSEKKAVNRRKVRDGSPENHVNPSWGRFNGDSWLSVLGCGAIMVFCPILAILFSVALTHFNGSITNTLWAYATNNPLELIALYAPRPTIKATLGYAAWLIFQAILYRWLPSNIGYGQRTPAGHLLPYKVNGLQAWALTHVLAVVAVYYGYLDPAYIAKNWDGLMVVFNVYGFFLAGISYVKAHLAPTHPDDRKFSGSRIYDFYMGIELNPRFGQWWDFKLFHNGRPGIVAWTLIDLSYAAWQYERIGYITNSMIIVNILHAFYVVDFFINEDWYLRTIDICHDHYGFYLAWGSMVWLPTVYTLQAQYLARYPVDLPTPVAVALLTIGVSGYIIFRSVNHQKDIVRRTGGECLIWGKKAEVIKATYKTEDGMDHESLLLCSGWWGFVRHANYLGDLILSYSVCAVCGVDNLLPWTYAIFMTILLIQRCGRDDARCTGKYGPDWKKYCSIVKYRIIPGIY
ncbi:uncharacterized protein LAJ45_08092 [Morchella importuna]|uniref:7-dehydrocholesterol reductase n=1 Tax=Morchella conica CCBAS932 TaxID=1392247 RepID=A0A3N4KVK6_9PEZI|nr:uncharacterized protein LAJ45_08092 [Morchella importuna]KAH8147990.1 hypothetical protein LAJ45_08092 [Morchella importuna]RPB13449.1 ERG4/ERG24 ergosterol biosynthesis protein [Morchella conica CCBAS932]